MIPLANFSPVPVRFRTMMMPAVAGGDKPTACLARPRNPPQLLGREPVLYAERRES